ncbi:MAG TPA: glycoside hydrolase family 97 catalytic domain-containing protein, partial [Lacipirellulaceae bacterium]|nr:glycoside hydrolase family 97 catalytic domain-containing protein [Lacipirellulaceae bacterium]
MSTEALAVESLSYHDAAAITPRFFKCRKQLALRAFVATALLCAVSVAHCAPTKVSVQSPDGRNSIVLDTTSNDHGQLRYTVSHDGRAIIGPSPIGPVLSPSGAIGADVRILNAKNDRIDEMFDLPWGKTVTVVNHCKYAIVDLMSVTQVHWQIELRAYDDGVAFRYRLLQRPGGDRFEIVDEQTRFDPVGQPSALFDTLASFTTSHEALYDRKPVTEIPVKKLIDMPVLLTWPHGQTAAITEARVRHFAGAYLERPTGDSTALRLRLAPLPEHKNLCVVGKAPLESPWRVVMIADAAGKLLESNLLLCLNDPPKGDFSWLRPGKTTFHWWYGEFEDDYKSPNERDVFYRRHCKYIDFCAKNNIAYHAISGDGYAWYVQSKTSYDKPKPDADVRRPRPELELPKIIAYARKRGVGIRLWVHWKPLSKHLEEAFSLYESWGVQGLMVDFLDRDDQEMIDWTEKMLDCAARHRLQIQIHGSSKYSGEQRTFPNLFNREGVLNLEYSKWSDLCTPAHSVNVAYTRALAGPVDFHLGGFRSVSRAAFKPRDRAPVV